jgi:hypothetical protein
MGFGPADILAWLDGFGPLVGSLASPTDSVVWSDGANYALAVALFDSPADTVSWSDASTYGLAPSVLGSGTWDNTTPINATAYLTVTALGIATVTVTPTGSITGGTVIFETDDGQGFGLLPALSQSGIQYASVSLSGIGATSWLVNSQNSVIRARLSGVITGTGNVVVAISSAPNLPLWVGTGLSIGVRESVSWQDAGTLLVGQQPLPADSEIWTDGVSRAEV